MKKIKIGYFADGPWAHKAIEKLLADETLEIAFVCARADNPDQILKNISIDKGIRFTTHQNVNSDEFVNWGSKFECDIFVSMSFNQIFKNKLINLPPLKTINCHAGKLPFYRGRNILNWVLINDESDFGITVHFVDEGIDTGKIILQENFQINDDDDYSTLLGRAYIGCAEVLYKAIKNIQKEKVELINQKDLDGFGFYCVVRKDGDEFIQWNQKSREVFNFVRAICSPGPQARTYLEGCEIKINKVQYLPEAKFYKGIVGSVVGVESDGFFVKTLDSFVKVIEWGGYSKPRIGDRFK